MIAIQGPLSAKKYYLYDLINDSFTLENKSKHIVSLEVDLGQDGYDLLIIENDLDPDHETSTSLALLVEGDAYGKKSFWCNCPGIEVKVFIRTEKVIEFDSYGNTYIPKKNYIETHKKHFIYVNIVSPELAIVIHYLSEEYYDGV